MWSAVGFDAAETLFYNRGLAEQLADWDRGGQPELEQATVARAVQAVGGRGLWPEDSAGYAERLARWSEFYRTVFVEAGLPPTEAAERGARCGQLVADPRQYALFDDVPPVLDRLAASGVPVCVISNFDPLIWDILDRLALRDRFRVVVTSWDVGSYKPDPRIFEVALERMRVSPQSMLYVGDSPYADVGGARAARMPALLLDRTDRHPTFDGPRITDLGKLPDWLETAGC
ncbi:HAD family hydrolase [Micromonospora sp. B11E3]|uniref:HAD family hydrolase n=1 Tax=Micromonospora sp. B11E3 TaxID=3153562 RepID=UPI00325DF3B6